MGCNEGDWVMANNDGDRTSPNSSSNDTARAFSEPTRSDQSANVSAGLSASRKPAIIAAIVVVVILAGFVAAAWFLYNHPIAASVFRDTAIILVGVETLIIGPLVVVFFVVMIYVALKIYDVVQLIQTDLSSMLNRADDTMRTVQSRAVFVSDTVVKPVVEIAAQVAAIRQTIKSFIRPRE
jgi:hypothetical protein